MSFVRFNQWSSDFRADLDVLVCEVGKLCLHTLIVGMVISCCFSVCCLFFFSSHHRLGSKISLCAQTPGHEGLSEVYGKSHFYIVYRFLLLSLVFSARKGCRCGEFQCTCYRLVAGKPLQYSFAVAQTVGDDMGIGMLIPFYRWLPCWR